MHRNEDGLRKIRLVETIFYWSAVLCVIIGLSFVYKLVEYFFNESDYYLAVEIISITITYFALSTYYCLRLFGLEYAVKAIRQDFNISSSDYAKGSLTIHARLFGFVIMPPILFVMLVVTTILDVFGRNKKKI